MIFINHTICFGKRQKIFSDARIKVNACLKKQSRIGKKDSRCGVFVPKGKYEVYGLGSFCNVRTVPIENRCGLSTGRIAGGNKIHCIIVCDNTYLNLFLTKSEGRLM